MSAVKARLAFFSENPQLIGHFTEHAPLMIGPEELQSASAQVSADVLIFDFSSYAGKKIYIGFRYEAAAGTSKFDVGTYEPDDIKISSK